MGRLSASAVKTSVKPGRVSDGDGLFLVIKEGGAKSWVCRVQRQGNRRDFGLGSASKVSLALVRERAREVRAWVELGLDPVFERRKILGFPTFREAAAKVLAASKKNWRNAKHEGQWLSTMEAYAFPQIGDMKVNDIAGPMIRDLLAPIWLTKPETARRVRQRVGAVLDWAYASGYRETEAPMRAITKGLPRQPKKDNHFAAMPYDKVAAFMTQLRKKESFSRLALQFAILTAARSGEVRGATWDAIDFVTGLWTIAAPRMKANREHVVPLTEPSLRILRRCAELRLPSSNLLFPGMKRGAPLSDVTLSKLMKEMGELYTVHGFRSAFRDWLSEATNHPGDVAEAALAHAIGNKNEAAYRRGNLLEKRRIIEPQGPYIGLDALGAARIADLSRTIRSLIQAVCVPVHPIDERIRGVNHVMRTDRPRTDCADGRNAVFYGERAIDRSPCGTGTSARMAQRVATGRLQVGDSFVHESYISSCFIGSVEDRVMLGDKSAIIPSIQGSAIATGFNTIWVDRADVFWNGFSVL